MNVKLFRQLTVSQTSWVAPNYVTTFINSMFLVICPDVLCVGYTSLKYADNPKHFPLESSASRIFVPALTGLKHLKLQWSVYRALFAGRKSDHLSVCIVAALDLDKRFNKILQRVVSVTLVWGGVLDNVQAIVKLPYCSGYCNNMPNIDLLPWWCDQ